MVQRTGCGLVCAGFVPHQTILILNSLPENFIKSSTFPNSVLPNFSLSSIRMSLLLSRFRGPKAKMDIARERSIQGRHCSQDFRLSYSPPMETRKLTANVFVFLLFCWFFLVLFV